MKHFFIVLSHFIHFSIHATALGILNICIYYDHPPHVNLVKNFFLSCKISQRDSKYVCISTYSFWFWIENKKVKEIICKRRRNVKLANLPKLMCLQRRRKIGHKKYVRYINLTVLKQLITRRLIIIHRHIFWNFFSLSFMSPLSWLFMYLRRKERLHTIFCIYIYRTCLFFFGLVSVKKCKHFFGKERYNGNLYIIGFFFYLRRKKMWINESPNNIVCHHHHPTQLV